MPRVPTTLITGSSGEIGHGLIERLAASGKPIVTLDLNPLAPELARKVRKEYTGSIVDTLLLDRVAAECEIDCVFHLAALLSTRSEFVPAFAHKVNVEGTTSPRSRLSSATHALSASFGRPSGTRTGRTSSTRAKRMRSTSRRSRTGKSSI